MWYQVHNSRVLQYNTPIVLPHLFRSSIINVNAALDSNAALPFGKRTYKYAGLLIPVFTHSVVGVSKGNARKIFLGNHQISFNNPLNYEFNLELVMHLWTPQLDLTIWETNKEVIFDVELRTRNIERQLSRIESKVDNINH